MTLSVFGHAEVPTESGYTALFNGADLTGWRVKAGDADAWSVQDSMLCVEGGSGENGWIETYETYSDFSLYVEWKVSYKSNSGVFVRMPDITKSPAYNAIEIQICDNENYPSFYIDDDPAELSGAVYAIIGPSHDVYRGIGEWNSYKITCIGDSIMIEFNEVEVIKISMADYPDDFEYFGKTRPSLDSRPRAGFIGLQQKRGGSKVTYRNVLVKDRTQHTPIQPTLVPLSSHPALRTRYIMDASFLYIARTAPRTPRYTILGRRSAHDQPAAGIYIRTTP